MLIATHADADHIQGLAKLKQLLKTTVTAHPLAAAALADGDRIMTFADIKPRISIWRCRRQARCAGRRGRRDHGRQAETRGLAHAGPHRQPAVVSAGNLLFCGDNIYRDGCVGVIDAHHGSDIPGVPGSLKRIRASDVELLLPSHGPVFRKDNALLDRRSTA